MSIRRGLLKAMVDPWEWAYIEGLPDVDVVPWTDEIAFERNPQYRRVYDKLYLAELQRQKVKQKGLAPSGWYVRPRVNLSGMGRGTTKSLLPSRIRPGTFAQQPLSGPHLTADLIVLDGKIKDSFTFKAHYAGNSFCLFESLPRVVNPVAVALAEPLLPGYTGVVNVETIGSVVLEMHLRPSLQFFDISGGLLRRLPELYLSGLWPFPVIQEKTYSLVIRQPGDSTFTRKPNVGRLSSVRSIQYCFVEDMPLSTFSQDEYSFRAAVVNGTDLESMHNMAEWIREELLLCEQRY